mmetsp:Transcript_52410/g.131743  ORF Transcript_52410/g.131743 Transcript_52410/m.131743 type:complete len:213 (-) Transcript_52410:631-1269(-)
MSWRSSLRRMTSGPWEEYWLSCLEAGLPSRARSTCRSSLRLSCRERSLTFPVPCPNTPRRPSRHMKTKAALWTLCLAPLPLCVDQSCFAFNPVDRPAAKEVLAKLGISSDAAPNGLSVSPAGVSPISPTSGVHTSMASTTTGLPSTVSPAQIKPVVPSEERASPGRPDASAESPPKAPQPQTKAVREPLPDNGVLPMANISLSLLHVGRTPS